MKLYPWLIQPYKNIIYQYQANKAHHAILIKSQKGIGVSRLIWFISRWLLCLEPIGIYFCNKCHGCTLMKTQNHPDWHTLKGNIFHVYDIRILNEKIFKRSQQDGNKIIYLSNIQKLTQSAVNAFLKTLEEPPKKTWFFFVNYDSLNLYVTLHSRCLLYKLFSPNEQDSLRWLKEKKSKKNISYLTALRISQGSPILAKNLIDGNIWIERENLYKHLFDGFKNKNFLKILNILNTRDRLIKIDWICILLFDSIKLNFSKQKELTNLDQIDLIKFISYNYKNSILDISIRTWMRCKHRLLNIPGVNCELLLIEQLLRWEKILHFIF
ncbi:DNA polymerase III subunit delta' [Buchnera aphidicola (Diuraphis noxia)]|uniref:DNA polymerase III subunit delta' n=1 Tax=Buchnera aphidicola subsp. Diuraphis noxia TaxID=118101 RepID=A0A1B2H954_BUCDN|nr:DNA polymerase III subunit delta' C-terminal domain-containing protein [Buchnera aphidicola]ANZ22559.1 DNA polymerase III subunit delta' [Buchnera aphidicola (Diuraphis noxia)]